MTFLNQILGTALMGIVSGHSAAELAQMDKTLRQSESRKRMASGKS